MLFKRKMLYKELICNWLEQKKSYIKESTYANYSNIVYKHLIDSLGKYDLKNLNHKVIQDFILEKHNSGLALKTVRDITNIIKMTLKYAAKENLINAFDLNFKYPKKENNNKIYVLSKKEQNKIETYILENLTSKNLGILLTMYSGIRIGELCALKWNDIDLNKNTLIINKTLQRIYTKSSNSGISKIIITEPKTHNSERVIPMSKEFANILKKFKSNNDCYILTNNSKWTEPRSYRRCFNKLLDKLNIKHINFHALRHTFATNCIKLGVDYKTVSELLGHSTINITLNLYVHPQMSEKKKCINLICKNLKEI